MFVAYYFVIHKNTDARDCTQFSVFIRRYDAYLKISEELIPMFGITNTADSLDLNMKILTE